MGLVEKEMRPTNRILYHLGILDPDCDETSEDEFD